MSRCDRLTKTVWCLVMLIVMAAASDPASVSGAETMGTTSPVRKDFASPEAAAKALAKAAMDEDDGTLVTILGPGSEPLVRSGDPVADRAVRERFLAKFRESHRIEETSTGRAVLSVGKEEWPFPVPIVMKGHHWIFDAEQGKEEILDRRIGRNELAAVQVVLAIVDAQREYAMKDRDGDGLLKYAQRFWSDPGKRNGLYWERKESEEQSPLGPLAARAIEEGYPRKQGSGGASPYHGYFFRMLMAQGKDAPAGAYDYVVEGKMIGGFAVVAYPAQYGNSGVMTFLVNHDGIVYERDLGGETATTVKGMTEFNPHKGWRKVE